MGVEIKQVLINHVNDFSLFSKSHGKLFWL